MLVIGFRFPGGRYHATPWGRHVNEADVEWPPSPWRIVRALIAVWHRQLDKSVYPSARLENLLAQLSASVPHYRLPPVVHSHTRHYMPVRDGSKDKNTLIFDAFARIKPEEELMAAWPGLNLDSDTLELLDRLLTGLAYLGRAESWVEARRLEPSVQLEFNCFPDDEIIDRQTVEIVGESVPLFRPLSPADYQKFRSAWLEQSKVEGAKAKGKGSKINLPEEWLSALSLETSDLQASGWSQPPAAKRVLYRRPPDSLPAAASSYRKGPLTRKMASVNTVRFAIYGRPLPRLEDAVKIGELARVALMSMASKHFEQVPSLLSGHDLPADNKHNHAFFLPEGNEQGHIDHLLVHAPGGFATELLRTMEKMRKIFTNNGREWQTVYEGAGQVDAFTEICQYAGNGLRWQSCTPYLRPWHLKKKFGIREQIIRECWLRGLPEPESVRIVPEVKVGSRFRRPVNFYRFRRKRGLVQPDTHGSFVEINFSDPVTGPLALGFGCHFGLGLFVPK